MSFTQKKNEAMNKSPLGRNRTSDDQYTFDKAIGGYFHVSEVFVLCNRKLARFDNVALDIIHNRTKTPVRLTGSNKYQPNKKNDH